jgi:CubicO group peptidase (beta-lactamase class C family)
MTQGGVGVHHDINDPTIKQTVVKDLTPIQEHLGLQLHKGRAGFYGWLGLGGSVAQWHPELQIGFAYVPNHLNFPDFNCTRGARMQEITK